MLDGEGPGRHLGVDLPLVVVTHLAQRVVDQAVLRPGVAVDPADDDEHGQVLGVGAGHGVHDAEAADAVGHDEGRDPVGARIAVGRVARVQLVAAPDHLEAGVGQELVEQHQVEVAGDDEVVPDPGLLQPGRQVAADGDRPVAPGRQGLHPERPVRRHDLRADQAGGRGAHELAPCQPRHEMILREQCGLLPDPRAETKAERRYPFFRLGSGYKRG